MAVQIRPTDVGKRVTVQFFDESGARREAVGILERADLQRGRVILHVRGRDEALVRVPLDRVRHGKVVQPPR